MSEEQKPMPPSGPPQWTYAVGAIGVIGTLVWAVVSHFIPKPEAAPPAKPAATAPTPAPTTPSSVTVNGTGNVGVGNMSGGSININAGEKK